MENLHQFSTHCIVSVLCLAFTSRCVASRISPFPVRQLHKLSQSHSVFGFPKISPTLYSTLRPNQHLSYPGPWSPSVRFKIELLLHEIKLTSMQHILGYLGACHKIMKHAPNNHAIHDLLAGRIACLLWRTTRALWFVSHPPITLISTNPSGAPARHGSLWLLTHIQIELVSIFRSIPYQHPEPPKFPYSALYSR